MTLVDYVTEIVQFHLWTERHDENN